MLHDFFKKFMMPSPTERRTLANGWIVEITPKTKPGKGGKNELDIWFVVHEGQHFSKAFPINEVDLFGIANRGLLSGYLDGSTWQQRIMSALWVGVDHLQDYYISAGALYEDVIRVARHELSKDLPDGKTLAHNDNKTLGLPEEGRPRESDADSYDDVSGAAKPTEQPLAPIRPIWQQGQPVESKWPEPVRRCMAAAEKLHLHKPMTRNEKRIWKKFVEEWKPKLAECAWDIGDDGSLRSKW
jgi:hypothetical protein